MSARPQGACWANVEGRRQSIENHRKIFILDSALALKRKLLLVNVMLFEPKLHQLNFRLLVRNDLLRQPAHL